MNSRHELLMKIRHVESPLFPLGVFAACVFIWPNAGIGNNGHCDAWYYWGMSHGSEIVRNALSWDYYPGSRAPLYIFGWLLPNSIDPILWSKLLMLINLTWPVFFILTALRREVWKTAINSYFLVSLAPIVFTQSSATYSGVTFNLLCILGLVLFLGRDQFRVNLIIGTIIGLVIFSNVQTLALAPSFAFLLLKFSSLNRLRQIFCIFCGMVISYLALITILRIGGLTLTESISFPSSQIITLIGMFGEKSFFGILENPWYLATPLLMFHVCVILLLIIARIRKYLIFPNSLLYVAIVQIVFLLFGQLAGLSVIFQSGFHAVFGYWILTPLIYFLLVYIREKRALNPALIAIAFSLSILSSQISHSAVSRFTNTYQLMTFSIMFPISCILLWLLFTSAREQLKSHFAVLILITVPLIGLSVKDYSAAFYYQENKPFSQKNNLTKYEYLAASKTVSVFSSKLKHGTAIGSLENPGDQLVTSMLRASTRSFASCKFPWSRFENVGDLSKSEFDIWPDHIIFGSYRFISEEEWKNFLNFEPRINHYKFYIGGRFLYWSEISK